MLHAEMTPSLHTNQPLPAEPVDAMAVADEWVETRFGKVRIDTASMLRMSNGLLGLPDKTRFFMTEFPGGKMPQFKLLQSLEDPKLSFIVLPLKAENTIVAKEDVLRAAGDLKISEASLSMLLIVSVHRTPSALQISVNARAPIFVHDQERQAAQYVFANNRYPVQYFISGENPTQPRN